MSETEVFDVAKFIEDVGSVTGRHDSRHVSQLLWQLLEGLKLVPRAVTWLAWCLRWVVWLLGGACGEGCGCWVVRVMGGGAVG